MARQCSPLWQKFMESSIINPAPSVLMKHLVTSSNCKLQISRLFIGHHTVVWFPFVSINHEGSSFTEKDRNKLNKASQAIQSPRTVPFFLLVSLLDGYSFPNVFVKGTVAFKH